MSNLLTNTLQTVTTNASGAGSEKPVAITQKPHPATPIVASNDGDVTAAIAPATTPAVTKEQPPVAANNNLLPLHQSNAGADVSPIVLKTLLQRFLQNFERVAMNYAVVGSAIDPSTPITDDSRMVFHLPETARKSMTDEQTSVLLTRLVNDGATILNKLGFDADHFRLNAENGSLSYRISLTKDKALPEGVCEKQVFNTLAQQLQAACNEARAAHQTGPAVG